MFYILQFINFKDVFIIFPEHYKINPYIEARELKNVLNFNHLFKNLKEQSCVIINNTHSSRKVNLLKKIKGYKNKHRHLATTQYLRKC